MVMAAMDLEARMRDAEERILRNELGLKGHEDTCALRYSHLNQAVEGQRADFRKVASAGAVVGLGVLGFLIKLVFFP